VELLAEWCAASSPEILPSARIKHPVGRIILLDENGEYVALRRRATARVGAVAEKRRLHGKKTGVGSERRRELPRARHNAAPIESTSRAAASERSMMRLSTKGPRSVIRTTVDLPLFKFVTRTMV